MESRQGLKEKNLEAFKKAAPAVHQLLTSHRPKSELVFDKKGVPDVKIAGRLAFDGKAVDFASRQLSEFWEHPTYIGFDVATPGWADRYINPFLAEVLKNATEAGIQFVATPPNRESFFLIVFGIGLGQHIDALLESVHPYFVLFIDPNIEFLYHSLEIYRWHALFDVLHARGGDAYFLFDNNPDRLSSGILGSTKLTCPPGLDGMLFFNHSMPELGNAIVSKFKKDSTEFIYGLGFFYDESLMLKNNYLNLRSGTAEIFVRSKERHSRTSAFVIGSGPSLDDAIPYIRGNTENAIIISGGSALRPLLVNGITPDFHIEYENIHLFSTYEQVSQEFDLSPICLVASTTVDPTIIRFFKDTVYYFRNSLSPFQLFGHIDNIDDSCLRHSDTTPLNAGLSFAMEIGITDIYFFGTDFGKREGDRHHSKDDVHYVDGNIIDDSRNYSIPVPANFGGTIKASQDLKVSLSLINEAILFYGKGHRFFNCSNGALIDRAKPLLAKNLSLDELPGGKSEFLKQVRNNFSVITKEQFNRIWNKTALVASVNKLADALKNLFGDPAAFEHKTYLARYMTLVRGSPLNTGMSKPEPDCPEYNAIASLLRGTIDMAMITVKTYLERLADPSMTAAFQHIVHREFTATIEKLRSDALAVIDDPTDIRPVPTKESWETGKDVVAERPQTWGHVGKNAPCPCRSGKRYKDCHG